MDINRHKNKRTQLKATLTRFENFYNNNKAELTDVLKYTELLDRFSKIENLLDEFNKIQDEIELETLSGQASNENENSSNETDNTERVNFETKFYKICSIVKVEINSRNMNSQSNNIFNQSNQESNLESNVQGVKLPTLHMPSFNGAYDKWTEFHETFCSLIDNNNALSKIQKFHYLRSALKNEAAAVIHSVEITEANYQVAWQLLKERYENKKLIVHNHLIALFSLPTVVKESYTALRHLLDEVLKHLRSLKALKLPVDQWDILIIFHIANKLDSATRREWESFECVGDWPTCEEFSGFLRKRCELLESLQFSSKAHNVQTNSKKTNPSTSCISAKEAESEGFKTSGNSCFYCKKTHEIYRCEQFLKLPTSKKIDAVKEHKVCFNCLKKGHVIKDCRTTSVCKLCQKRHNTLLHLANSQKENESSAVNQGTSASMSHESVSKDAQILLSTAAVKVFDNEGNAQMCRVLLDSGSQSNFITEQLCTKLQLKKEPTTSTVSGISQLPIELQHIVNLTIKSSHGNYSTKICCFVLTTITGSLPVTKFDPAILNVPKNLRLADPLFYNPSDVDLLIGSNLFWSLITTGQIRLGDNMPILQNSKLGWIIAGTVPVYGSLRSQSFCSIHNLEKQLNKFWSIEEFSVPPMTKDDSYCEEFFNATTKRDSSGRFIVQIPFKDNLMSLGESKEIAKKRFLSLENKLQKNTELHNDYVTFMREYEDMGHMSKIISESNTSIEKCYLPHQAVIRTDRITTKLRVVFDGSTKTTSGLSINDVQHVGPALQNDLWAILVRFRTFKYAITADISKMYRQILIADTDRDYQRILWRENPKQPISTYRLNTITYGTASAPYLANRVLKQIALDNQINFPKISNIINNDFYVDDLLTGANSEKELFTIHSQLTEVLINSCLPLRKWDSNSQNFLEYLAVDNDTDHLVKLGTDSKTLGLLWNTSFDSLQFSKPNRINFSKITKRTVLSVVAQIYDPLGLISPLTIIPKILIQKLWLEKLSWDDSIPTQFHSEWIKFANELSELKNISIQRQVLDSQAVEYELHAFCDASEVAYGASVYIRSISTDLISSKLLCAKSKVAPLKNITLPRLELCGATLLSELVSKVIEPTNITFKRQFYWTDSTITLGWIRGNVQKYKTFVANRVSVIQQLTDVNNWYHVRTYDNPADLISRGARLNIIQNSELWWHGPTWLRQNSISWPQQIQDIDLTNLPDLRQNMTLTSTHETNVTEQFDLLSKFSSMSKLKRVTAYCLRFIKNCRNKDNKLVGLLSVTELKRSEIQVLKLVQQESFSKELNKLKDTGIVDSKSKLLQLHPFVDENNLIRVGGRLSQSSYSINKKYPIVLPKSHHITNLIIREEHVRLLHAGPQTVLGSLRERYWILAGRNQVKKVIRNCIVCFRVKPTDIQQIMGDLPEYRVTPSKPFNHCGVDYAGPFLIKDRRTRGAKLIKIYICLFICMSTKAIHLEVVCDLTTDSFLKSLHRFVSRRGLCEYIYSDNATTFIGAKNQLRELYQFLRKQFDIIHNTLGNKGITWSFIPPKSPNFGGIWEAGIKSAKSQLKRVILNSNLTYEDFVTVLTEIEACLNSRPLYAISDNPNDLSPLTPAHFLIGGPLTNVPEPSYAHIKTSRLSAYQRSQQITQQFWKRWSREYLAELQQRCRWKTKSSNIQLGQLVLLKEDNLPPLQWKLGRIVHLYPGQDGAVRVVDLKTESAVLKRNINKLCPLPVES